MRKGPKMVPSIAFGLRVVGLESRERLSIINSRIVLFKLGLFGAEILDSLSVGAPPLSLQAHAASICYSNPLHGHAPYRQPLWPLVSPSAGLRPMEQDHRSVLAQFSLPLVKRGSRCSFVIIHETQDFHTFARLAFGLSCRSRGQNVFLVPVLVGAFGCSLWHTQSQNSIV
jgi:hypothetical protein